ncbi:MoaD/ThiS family protein [Endothiovibrio diazotrophicus]
MTIQVRFFASLRERLGRDGCELEAAEGLTVAEVWARAEPGQPLPANTLTAVNQEYCDLDTPVRDGDEVAFFPPVTGG